MQFADPDERITAEHALDHRFLLQDTSSDAGPCSTLSAGPSSTLSVEPTGCSRGWRSIASRTSRLSGQTKPLLAI